jgi:hypothetical protein
MSKLKFSFNVHSATIIHRGSLILSGLCLLSALTLSLYTPEGALFLFAVGCSWLGLSFLALDIRNYHVKPPFAHP